MIYTLIGRIVVKGGKLYLRRRFGPTYVPVPVLAGATVAVVIAIALLAGRSRSRQIAP